MAGIQSHEYTLYGGSGTQVVLRPLRSFFEKASREAFCFLIEYGGAPVGECRLQRTDLPEIRGLYPPDADVRGISLTLHEKDGENTDMIGCVLGILVYFSFAGEHADLLHCIAGDENIRSREIWKEQGFMAVAGGGKAELHFRLTRQEYIAGKRYTVPPEKLLALPVHELQPSQLYICDGKLRLVREWLKPPERNMDPIPVRELDGRLVMLDGHTRAAAACLGGQETVPVYMDRDEWDPDAYRENVRWCREAGVRSPHDLVKRVISFGAYEELWIKRCMDQEDRIR